MKKLLSIFVTLISASALASGYVSSDGYQTSSSSNNNSGYQTSTNSSGGYRTSSNRSSGYVSSRPSNGYRSSSNHHHKKSTFSVFVNMPQYQLVQRPAYVVTNHPHSHLINYIQWVNTNNGYPIPQDAVVGGAENYGENLFICHGYFNGDLHPGKIVDGSCHISYGGREIALSQYSTLVSPFALTWIQASQGYVPTNAIEGGYENGHPLYICQARYNGGTHPGKIIGSTCNIAWGGQEISIPNYNVLVRA